MGMLNIKPIDFSLIEYWNSMREILRENRLIYFINDIINLLSFDLFKGFLKVWAQLKQKYAQTLLFLFSISHLLIVNHPDHTLDLSYIHLFQAVDEMRWVSILNVRWQKSISPSNTKGAGYNGLSKNNLQLIRSKTVSVTIYMSFSIM